MTRRMALLCGLLVLQPPIQAEVVPPVHSLTVLSKTYDIKRKYKSMEGPASAQPIVLLENQPPELVWITGFRTVIVGSDGKSATSQEFMCHINLDADIAKHKSLFGWEKNVSNRLFTLSQAQFSVDFPKGFGMPVMSDEAFSLATQVLNHNVENPNIQVRHKVTIDFIRDRDLKEPMIPLFSTNAFVMRMLEGKDGNFGMPIGEDGKHGPSCLPGLNAKAAGSMSYPDQFGRKFSGHWVVEPGRKVSHTNVTKLMNIPFDTTLHYINIHLHPFAEWIELTDLTTGKRIYKSHARGPKQGIGLEQIDSYSSRKGVPMYKDHEYDLAVSYNNTSGVEQDAMATMFLYLEDKEFKKPSAAAVAQAEAATIASPIDYSWIQQQRQAAAQWVGQKVMLKTTMGNIVLSLDPKTAPVTVAHFMELVKAGAYDSVKIVYLAPGFLAQMGSIADRVNELSATQRTLAHRVPLEPGGSHVRGVLSMARDLNDFNSGDSSFCIMLGNAPQLNGKYTVFGKVETGMDVLDAIEKAPRNAQNQPQSVLQIEKVEVMNDGKTPHVTLPRAAPAVAAEKPQPAPEKLRLETSLGVMTFNLYPKLAPKTVEQIERLVRAGDYDSTHIFRVEPGFVAQLSLVQDRTTPLTPAQQALLHKIPAEFSAVHHHRGILSMARETNDVNSGESSFSILLGDAAHLDGQYTIFGEMESGASVLDAIEKVARQGNAPVTRIDILKAEII